MNDLIESPQNMQALATREPEVDAAPSNLPATIECPLIVWDVGKRALFKDMICKDATDNEIELAVHLCTHFNLDPFARQIYFIKRYSKALQRQVMMPQTSIDGYRVIAERTRRYAPGRETTYEYNSDSKIYSATAHIKKLTDDRTWHEVDATAIYKEYEVGNNDLWTSKPHVMIAKCAEALALRKAFPADLSGLYVDAELDRPELTPSPTPAQNENSPRVEPRDERKQPPPEDAVRTQVKLLMSAWHRKFPDADGRPVKDRKADFVKWAQDTYKTSDDLGETDKWTIEMVACCKGAL